jgi:hypothetical protein
MTHKPFLAMAAAAGCATGPVQPLANPPPPALPSPAMAMFGRSDDRGRFLRLTDLALEPGMQFGWRIRLPCTGPVEYVETLVLPAPGDWSQILDARRTDPRYLRETSISDDGRTTVTHDYAACVGGWIEHQWTIAAADPPGEWSIKVEIAGYAAQHWRVRFR